MPLLAAAVGGVVFFLLHFPPFAAAVAADLLSFGATRLPVLRESHCRTALVERSCVSSRMRHADTNHNVAVVGASGRFVLRGH